MFKNNMGLKKYININIIINLHAVESYSLIILNRIAEMQCNADK